MRKKVLVIAYYWPPSAGSGVQRWLKFVKYLREYGWEPVVYTPENPDFELKDPRLALEIPEGIQVVKRPIFEPFETYRRLTGQKNEAQVNPVMKGEGRVSWKARVALWIRANIFIPDSRMFWIRPSVRFLVHWLKENPVDALVSTGPPHSMHRIALGVKRRTGLPWLADFRDPWTRIDFYHELPLEPWADRMHRKMEAEVLREADHVVVVGNQMKEELAAAGFGNLSVVTNGYDPADLPAGEEVYPDTRFSIIHIGMLGVARSHPLFWNGLEALRKENPELARHLEVRIYGVADPVVQQQIAGFEDKSWIHFLPYVPHSEVIRIQQKAAVLLLSVNNVPSARGIITGKIFEYLAIGRPVLCMGPPDGDAAHIIRQAQAGPVVGFTDEAGFRKAVTDLFEAWKTGQDRKPPAEVSQYSRKALCGKIAEILDGITEGKR